LTPSRRLILAGLLVGALIRGLLLPLPGTGDVVIWKVWSFAASHDVTGVYGVGGSPPERRVLEWQGEAMTVDYPPLALYELALVGRAYRAVRPLFDDSAWLNAAVKMPGVLAELGFALWLFVWLRRRYGEDSATWAALAVWLNPARLLDGAALGYLDAVMAVPLAGAALAAWLGHPAMSGVLLAVAVMTKAQAVFVGPVVLALILWRSRSARAALAFAGTGAATAAVLLMPFVVRGAWPNLVQAGQAANLWWIVTWLLRVIAVWPEWSAWDALTLDVRILGIARTMELGYPNARVVGLVLVGIALVWACLRVRRAGGLADTMALAAWCAYAYAMLAAQVHENHLAPAVALLAPAAASERTYRRVFWAITGIVAANLYLFYGLGDGWPPVVSRSITGIDATVVLSVVSVLTFGWFTRLVARRTRPGPPEMPDRL
jgi:hypothetical protein